MIRLPVRELELLRDRVVALLQFERAHADLTDETWIARRLELRLKLQAINDQIDQERQAHLVGLYLDLDQRHAAIDAAVRSRRQAEWEQRQETKRQEANRRKPTATGGTGWRLWADVPLEERVDEKFMMRCWGAQDPRWLQHRLDLAKRAVCAAAVRWKDASRFDRWSQCVLPTAPGARFCRVHGGPAMPPKDYPPQKKVEPVMPQRMWMHPTEPAEVIPPVPITECQPARDLAPHLSYTEIESRARSLVSHHYASMGRKRSRRYEGFR